MNIQCAALVLNYCNTVSQNEKYYRIFFYLHALHT